MKILFDTSVLIDIERKNEKTIEIVKILIDGNDEILISTVTISELLAGCYRRHDQRKAVDEARKLLGQFTWAPLDAKIAIKTAQYLAFLASEGKMIEYPDAAIAATAKETNSDYLITLNKAHFLSIPDLKGKVHEPKEIGKILK